MFEKVWNSFWKQLTEKKNIKVLDSSSFFHYVVLEFLKKMPSSKVSKEEQRYIRELKKGNEEYEKLFELYNNRMKEYTIS